MAVDYANKMISGSKSAMMLVGLFNRARCAFFLGDFTSLRSTVKQFEEALSNMNKMSQKAEFVNCYSR